VYSVWSRAEPKTPSRHAEAKFSRVKPPPTPFGLRVKASVVRVATRITQARGNKTATTATTATVRGPTALWCPKVFKATAVDRCALALAIRAPQPAPRLIDKEQEEQE
jgi:hypothetical protein